MRIQKRLRIFQMNVALGFVLLLIISGDAFCWAPPDDIHTARGLADGCLGMVLVHSGDYPEGLNDGDLAKLHLSSGYCFGFVTAHVEAISFAKGQGLPPPYCAPDGATYIQVARVYIQYVERNPSREHEDATSIFLWALSDAWPCSPG